MASSTSSASISNSVPANRLELVVDVHAVQFFHRAVLAGKLRRQHREIALGAFFVA